MTAILLAMALMAGDPKVCHDNLCGMDSYCSCHANTTTGEKRCWTTAADCEVDRMCCDSGKCKRLERDACAEKTAAERKKRDGK